MERFKVVRYTSLTEFEHGLNDAAHLNLALHSWLTDRSGGFIVVYNDHRRHKFSPGGCVAPGPSVSEQLQAELEPIPAGIVGDQPSYPGRFHVG